MQQRGTVRFSNQSRRNPYIAIHCYFSSELEFCYENARFCQEHYNKTSCEINSLNDTSMYQHSWQSTSFWKFKHILKTKQKSKKN